MPRLTTLKFRHGVIHAALAVLLLACNGRGGREVVDGRTRVIAGEPCEGCVITSTPVAVLRSSDGVTIQMGSALARDGAGRFLAAPIAEEGLIARWSPTGAALPPYGRRGEGPGEFIDIKSIALTPGDSILVLDLARITLLSPEGVYVRSANNPPGVIPFRVVALPGGGMLLNNTSPANPAFVELDPQFEVRRRFGPTLVDPPAVAPNRDSLLHLIAVASGGGVWTLPLRYRYALTKWDGDREQESELTRTVSWFPAWDRAAFEVANSRPPWVVRPLPLPLAFGVDSLDHLWTMTRIARDDWAPIGDADTVTIPSPHARVASAGPARGPDPARFVETAVEVLDPSTATPIAAGRLPFLVRGLLGRTSDGYALEEDDQGLLQFQVFRLSPSPPLRR